MSPTILLAVDDESLSQALFTELSKFEDVDVCLPNESAAKNAQIAACWYPDQDILTRFSNIQCLHSVAAGVDHLGKLLLESGLPIARIVDVDQKRGMLEYILWCVLNHHRDFDRAALNQRQQLWHLYPQTPAKLTRVGVMGLGEIGGHVAAGLSRFGYTVAGWSRSKKNIDGIETFSGKSEFAFFLENTDVLVNLLPLNEVTQGILNQSLFCQLPKGACVINAGRGGHLHEGDLISALKSKWIRSAVLDVFSSEPLPANHPLWSTEGVIVTPHMASSSSAGVIADQLRVNAVRFIAGESLNNQFNSTLGY